MKRVAWLGLAAMVAVVVAALGYGRGTVTAQAPMTIQASGPAVAAPNTNFTLTFELIGPGDPWAGYNLGVVYDTNAVDIVSVIDQSGPNMFGGSANVFCPPAIIESDIGGTLPPPLKAFFLGCASLVGPTSNDGVFALATVKAVSPGVTAFHMISAGPPDNGGATFGTTTLDASANIQFNPLVCGGATCGPLSVPGSQPWDVVVFIPLALQIDKTASASSIVAGQPMSFTITVNNPSGSGATATNVVITDTFPAAFMNPTENPDDPNCSIAGQVLTCNVASIPDGGSFSVTVDVTVDPNAGNTSPQNCASVASDQSFPAQDCVTVAIIPPAVAWQKSPTIGQTFLMTGSETFTFDEIMINQGDPSGLGAFEFTLHYDNTIWQQPQIDLSPAVALFASAGRTLDCSITVVLETQVHVACASTGPIGSGPVWVGPQVMAHVTLTPRAIVGQTIRPNKENGLVTWVKDTGVEAANTCGQPLNDGTGTPLPGQSNECQGQLLLGVLPGGQIENADTEVVITLRRLEADVDKDCDVDVVDMQIEAGKYGFDRGSLLYNVWYDLEPHLANGDGDIDIKDVQFVYGRFGSTCLSPIPPQVPQPLP